jgi:hypothetical protein
MVERYRPKDYVGYKRPPTHTRFQKGQSGNPNGRPQREPVSVATIVAEELQSTVSVTENGQPLKTDKVTLLVKQALNQGIKGNLRAVEILMKTLDSLDRVTKTPTKKYPRTSRYDDVDIAKLSLAEKMKMMREMIENSKPLDEY